MKLIPILVTILGLGTGPSALAQSCCGGQAGSHAACNMASRPTDGHESQGTPEAATPGSDTGERHVFMKPVQLVFDDYIKVQRSLAQDSLQGINNRAVAMAEVIRTDSMKRLSPKIADQADALANAKDLETARAAFKSLSDSLIGYLNAVKPSAGVYHVAYCPMAKASWVQTDKTIMNPYMGKQMIHCGQIKS